MHIPAKLTIFLQLVVISLVTVGIVSAIGPVSSSDVKGASTTDTSLPVGGQTLQVRDAIGDPKPLTSPLQGTNGQKQQQAGGSLQKQSSEALQPNAKMSEFPEEFN